MIPRQTLETILAGLPTDQLLKALSVVGVNINPGQVDDEVGGMLDLLAADQPLDQTENWQEMEVTPGQSPKEPVHDPQRYSRLAAEAQRAAAAGGAMPEYVYPEDMEEEDEGLYMQGY